MHHKSDSMDGAYQWGTVLLKQHLEKIYLFKLFYVQISSSMY